MTALLRTPNFSSSICDLDIFDLRLEAVEPFSRRIAYMSPSPVVSRGVRQRPAVSGGVVNRFVVKKQHVRLVASNAKKNGEEAEPCAEQKICGPKGL